MFWAEKNNSGKKNIVENKFHNERERTENCVLILLKEWQDMHFETCW